MAVSNTPMHEAPRRTMLLGDARFQLQQLPANSVDMVLTSPPYFRCRDYETDGQLGLESQIEEWVAGLRQVMSELARVIVPTGGVWLNLGDSYATHAREGAPRKSLLLGPERLALALLQDGWLLRNKIAWAKPNPVPSSVRDRLTCSWEVIYVLVRQPSYFYALDAVRQPHTSRAVAPKLSRRNATLAWLGPSGNDTRGLAALSARGLVGHPLGKNPTDVWRIAPGGFRSAHHATFPIELADRAIRAGCPERRCRVCLAPWTRRLRRLGATAVQEAIKASCQHDGNGEPGLVLDPFMGAGTTAVAAEALSRDWLGIELNPDFMALAERRVAAARNPNQTQRARAA